MSDGMAEAFLSVIPARLKRFIGSQTAPKPRRVLITSVLQGASSLFFKPNLLRGQIRSKAHRATTTSNGIIICVHR